jgi:hypothetical protein
VVINSSRHFQCKGESIFNTLSDRVVIMALPFSFDKISKLHESAILVEILEVKKAVIYKPSLQKMSSGNW